MSIVHEEHAESVMHVYSNAISIMEQALVLLIVVIVQVVHDPFLKITFPTNVEKQIVIMVVKVGVAT